MTLDELMNPMSSDLCGTSLVGSAPSSMEAE